MSAKRFLWYYLWIAPHILLGLVAVLMVRRKLCKDFPLFLCYAISEVLQTAALFAFFYVHSSLYYSYVFMIGGGLIVAFQFGVIHEVFENVLGDSAALKRLATFLFRWATALLLLVAVAVAAYTSGGGANRLTASIRVTSKIVSIVQCGLIIFLLLFVRYFRLSWRSYAFGAALGLGIYASVSIVTSAIATQFGNSMTGIFDLIEMGTFHCSVLIWLFYLLMPEPEPRKVEAVNLEDVQTWNRELQRLLQQ